MSAPGAVRQQLNAASQPAPGPPGPQPPATGGGGGLAEFAQAFARCEQSGQCSPQDRAILQAGLPKLIQMAQAVQHLLAASAGGGAPPAPGGQPPQPAPGA